MIRWLIRRYRYWRFRRAMRRMERSFQQLHEQVLVLGERLRQDGHDVSADDARVN